MICEKFHRKVGALAHLEFFFLNKIRVSDMGPLSFHLILWVLTFFTMVILIKLISIAY